MKRLTAELREQIQQPAKDDKIIWARAAERAVTVDKWANLEDIGYGG